MLGLLGLATSLGGAAWSAYQSAKANKEAKSTLTNEHNARQQWYNGKLAEDYTQRTDVQAVLSRQRDLLKDAYNSARAKAVVSGAGDEQAARMRAQGAESIANATTSIAEGASQYKDNLESAKMAESQDYAGKMANISNQQAQQATKAGQSLLTAGTSLMNEAYKGGEKKGLGWLWGKG